MLFDSQVLNVKQPGKLLPTQAAYEYFDAVRNRLAVAAETDPRTRLDLLKGALPGAPIPGTRTLIVTTGEDQPALVLTKHADGRLTELRTPTGDLVGRIRSERTTRHFSLTGTNEEALGSVVGDLALKKFTVTGPAGDKIARVSKTWAGIKELLTPADHYQVDFSGSVPESTRMLIAMIPIVIDLTHYGPV